VRVPDRGAPGAGGRLSPAWDRGAAGRRLQPQGEPNHLLHIDKAYYFQLDEAGNLTNWSGCGNDLRCDTPMGRRLIIDSLTHLVETYDVDGFRFDLAELIGVEVLREIEAALKRVKPSIVLIAEPWSFRGHIAWS
jgi:pullulanase